MKILRFFLFMAATLLAVDSADAQNTMRIYLTNGTVQEIGISEIDKIDWFEKLSPDFEDETINGHKYVDLGLPSGTLWATCNIGADNEKESGLYFWWGDVVGHKADDTSFNFSSSNPNILTNGKYYLSLKSQGIVHNQREWEYATNQKYTIYDLTSEYDVSNQLWGDKWHTPTIEEVFELFD